MKISKDSFYLTLFVLIATAVNITKAVHIDDTAYLEIARAIINNPLRPLSQKINWGDTAEPIFMINQPLLVPYIYAFLIKIFGESELVLHLFMAVCSASAISFFYMVSKLFYSKCSIFLTGLFALGPSFLPGQNLMVDVPLVACWLIFFWAIILTEIEDRRKYVVAALALSFACLVKYTSLVLFPIFICSILYRRHYKSLWVVSLPLVVMILWSCFNYLDFGAVHLFGRPTLEISSEMIFQRIITLIAGLGAMSPFLISFLSLKGRRKTLLLAMLSTITFVVYLIKANQIVFFEYWVPFFILGFLLTCFAILNSYQEMALAWSTKSRVQMGREIILALWLTGTCAFLVLFSPFLASRHILLIMPPILILLGRSFSKGGIVIPREVASFILTAGLGLTLAVSDYSYANIYKDSAYKIRSELPADARVYQIGHWGWQWYSLKAGMLQYDSKLTSLKRGDYLVAPLFVHNQTIAPDTLSRMQVVRRLIVPNPNIMKIRTIYSDFYGGGYYAFQYPTMLPWRFSQVPFEFVVFQVNK